MNGETGKMKVTSSYGVEIKKQNICIRKTLDVYRAAVAYLVPVYDSVYPELAGIPDKNRCFNKAEHMVHTTKANTARFDFDSLFPKMPSYLRRSAIRSALGSVFSFHSRLALWKEEAGDPSRQDNAGANAGKPVLTAEQHAMPVFYRDVMYREIDPIGEKGEDAAFLKLYDGHDWVWNKVRLSHTDMEYLRRNWSGKEAAAPVLEKKYKKYFLRFSFTEEVKLSDRDVQDQRICAVDLGLNTDAVCSVMAADGTVLARRFITFACEKDHLYHVLGRIRNAQREHGSRQCRSFRAYAVRLNKEAADRTGAAIAAFAKETGADVIVFEHLDINGKIRGSKKQKLALWKKQGIQKICEHQAHRMGIRISRICPWNTSAFAYDGSGKVERDQKNRSLCRFANGKQYNCDLSASYNIGARYFIREITKPLPETARSLLEAKVPSIKRRTSCVYADLVKLVKILGEEQAA